MLQTIRSKRARGMAGSRAEYSPIVATTLLRAIKGLTLLPALTAVACTPATTNGGQQSVANVDTPRSSGMPLPTSWFCFGHLGNARQMPSTDCYPNKLQCDQAQIEYQVARTGQPCTNAPQAYCTTPAATTTQPTLTFTYTNQTTCFAAPNYCEAQRQTQQARGKPMSECQLIQSQGITTFPPL